MRESRAFRRVALAVRETRGPAPDPISRSAPGRLYFAGKDNQPERARIMPRETILIDADDTLWENNVFFEQTIEEFLTLLEPLGFKRDYARHILNETERRNIRQHGYGVRSFGRSLEETYMKLAGHQANRETVEGINAVTVMT